MSRGKVGRKSRGIARDDEATRALIGIWHENSIEHQLEDATVNNRSNYKSLSAKLTEKSFKKTSDQCKVKIHTLKRTYCLSKSNMKKVGRSEDDESLLSAS